MGAALAGATSDQRAALEAYAAPVGVAFQLRDDLLGVFGDPDKTGKPLGGDLTQGKRSAVVIEAEHDASIQHKLSGVIGNPGASEAAIAGALEALRGSGVKQRVEARLEVLLAEATEAASRGPFTDLGRSLLVGAVNALGVRED
jgi:geranylgeranyl diphosphate synthase type I